MSYRSSMLLPIDAVTRLIHAKVGATLDVTMEHDIADHPVPELGIAGAIPPYAPTHFHARLTRKADAIDIEMLGYGGSAVGEPRPCDFEGCKRS